MAESRQACSLPSLNHLVEGRSTPRDGLPAQAGQPPVVALRRSIGPCAGFRRPNSPSRQTACHG